MRITSKIVLLVSLSVAIVMGVVSWISVQQTEEALYKGIDNQLTSTLDLTAERLNRNSLAAKKTSEIIAHNPAISKALSLDVSVGVNQILNQMLDIYPFYNYIIIVTLDGDIFAVNTQDKKGDNIAGEELLGLNVMKTPLFLPPPTTPETIIGGPGPDPYLSLLGIKARTSQWFVAPVFKGPVPVGWVVLSYDWQDELSALLTHLRQDFMFLGNPVIDVALVDEKGKVVVSAHSFNEEFVQSPDQVWKEKQLSFGKATMKLIIASDRTKINEPITRIRNFFIGLIGVATIILLGLLYFILQKIFLAKLKAIQGGSNEFKSGNLAYRLPSLGHDELGLLASTFNEMGQSLQNASNELELKVEERTAELRESEERFRLIFETSPLGIIRFDTNGVVTHCNQVVLGIMGSSREQMIGFNLLTSLRNKEVRKAVESVLSGKAGQFEGEYTSVTGEKHIWIKLVYAPISNTEGLVTGGLGIIEDITERKRAEESQKEASAFINTLLNAIPIPIFYKDTDGRFRGFNKSFEEFFGKTSQELIGKGVFDMYPEDLAKVYHAKDSELFHNPGNQVYDTQFKDARGAVHDVVFHKSTFLDSQGHVVGLIGAILDITERKRAEDALRESEEKFQTVADFTYAWEYWIDPDGRLIYVSPSCERITGYRSAEFINNPGLLKEIIHPEDRSLVSNHFASIGRGEAYAVEFRIVTRTGETRWIGHNCQPVCSEDGRWLGRRTGNRDITERKQAEDQLRRANQEQQRLLSTAATAIFTLDSAGIITGVNEEFCSITGFERDDIIGKTSSVLGEERGDESYSLLQ